MKDINAVRGQIADVVGQAMVETFNSMFGQNVSRKDVARAEHPANIVLACIRLNQSKTEVDFCFKFDQELLLLAAKGIFTADYLKNNPVHDDLACEIANIVCAKVKAYLNDHGYDTEMGFPFNPHPDQAQMLLRDDVVHMHFFYRGQDDRQGVGALVNFEVN